MNKFRLRWTFFWAFFLFISCSPAAAGESAGGHPEYRLDSFGGMRIMAQSDVEDDDFFFPEDLEQEEEKYQIADPIRPFNVAMYHFNDKLYFWVLKPAAKGWKAVVPETARTGLKNFFHNILAPVRFFNSLFQLKGEKAVAELGGFMLNTTFGVLGFGNPAKNFEDLRPDPEDAGQTLGHYGIGHGLYLVLPFLGPSSARDALGLFGDSYLDPITYIDDFGFTAGCRATDTVNSTSFRIGDYEALKEAALEPYDALKNAYLQRRTRSVNN